MATTPADISAKVPSLESLEQRFRRLEAKWKADTEFLSDAGKLINHPAFKAIIALGEEVVPLMLHDLERQPSLWVWALPEITGESPVPAGEGAKFAR